jgi:signal transduction histidine kinase
MLYVIANRVRDLTAEENTQNVQYTKDGAENIRKSILSVAEDVRRISLDLRPSILDDLSLVPAIRWLIDRLNQENGLNIQITVFGKEKVIRPESDVMIYRIIQEALNNVKKHSKATDVWVMLKFTTNTCQLKIQDNGIGFSIPPNAGHFVSEGKLGLIGMQQRSEFMGGSFKVQSEPGKGTTISVEVPL